MEKIVFSNKIKTAFFIGFLIIFGFFLFNQNVSAFIPPATFQKNIDFFIDGTNDAFFALFKPEYNPEIIYSHGTWTYSEWKNTDISIATYNHLYEVNVNLNGGVTDPNSIPTYFLQDIQDYPTGYYWLGYKSPATWAPAWTEENSTFWPIYWDGSILSYSQPYTGLPYCGSDDGLLIETTPTNLCETGEPTTPIFDGIRWDWECQSGVVYEVCRAYASTDNPIDGTCGIWDGLDFDVWPDVSELCGISSSLIFPSMLETIDTYTWTCSGFNGGNSSYCSADKTTPTIFPELPTGSLDDCSGLGIPEVWFCNISNTIKSIFLPSAEKITELNETINKISGRFPFSYINMARNVIKEVNSGITESEGLSLSILGSESQSVNFADIPFIKIIKIFSTILITFLFLFWLRSFIIHIF